MSRSKFDNAQLVNNLDELGFTDVEPYLSEYLTKTSKEDTSILDTLIHISEREISLGILELCDFLSIRKTFLFMEHPEPGKHVSQQQ